MKKLLNTLYVTTQGSYVSKKDGNVTVSVDKEIKCSLPVNMLEGIVCFGRISCSPFLMELCAKNGILVSFVDEYTGRFLARVQGTIHGNVMLRKEQYRQSDDIDISAKVAKSIVTAKVLNSRTVLLRFLRDCKEENIKIKQAINTLGIIVDQITISTDLEVIRGYEGNAARVYFEVFNDLIIMQKADFIFTDRNKRPPLDNINALLSFIYTIVLHDVVSACETVGLDSYVGFLHRDRSGRDSLALDLMEEFRSFLADRLVLSLINRLQVKPEGFTKRESGEVCMNEETRRTLLHAYQEKKKEEIIHPFINEKIKIGLIPYVQALLFSRYLRGDLDSYPPFIWK